MKKTDYSKRAKQAIMERNTPSERARKAFKHKPYQSLDVAQYLEKKYMEKKGENE